LLLAYAFDDEPVEVIDLVSGEEIPDEVLKALTDLAIIKTALMLTLKEPVWPNTLTHPCRQNSGDAARLTLLH